MSAVCRAGLLVTVLVIVLSLAGPASAVQPAGLEPGVHVDPGSPAAKEYALPLSQARKTGGGGGLFGAGIRPPASPRRQETARRLGRSGANGDGHGTAGRRPDEAGASTASARASPASAQPLPANADASSGDSLLALLGSGVAILAVGVLAGTILRRRPHAQDN